MNVKLVGIVIEKYQTFRVKKEFDIHPPFKVKATAGELLVVEEVSYTEGDTFNEEPIVRGYSDRNRIRFHMPVSDFLIRTYPSI